MIEDGRFTQEFGLVVVDELHMVDENDRGNPPCELYYYRLRNLFKCYDFPQFSIIRSLSLSLSLSLWTNRIQFGIAVNQGAVCRQTGYSNYR